MSLRKVGRNRDHKPVLPDVRLPDEHYQPGDTAEVVFKGAVGTIRPKGHKDEPPEHLAPIPASHGLDVPS